MTSTEMKSDSTQLINKLLHRINQIIPNKSPSDPRDYKIITLSNDLECILVSDPEAEKAACAMCVRVGHFADPNTLPGLAHFLEHMLFLGTKKYPNEAEYNQYLKDHGGTSNASTGMHDTCYQFDVGSDHLEEAIDRFAQFFIDPLFTASATDRELNAVNSENSNNEQSDPHRFYQFDKSLARESHPFHKFGTGNIETLKENVPPSINVRSELLAFHAQYYSSSVMKLAIVGKQDIDTLSALVTQTFSAIANKKISEPKYENNIEKVFHLDTNPILYKLVPITEKRELRLNWTMRSCYYDSLTSPTSLLSYCLGDESPGSILSFLKQRGYATGLMAGLNYNLPEFSFMVCNVYLTPKGLQNYAEIIRIIYSYISKMKALTDTQWKAYFGERSKVRTMNFNFKGKEKSYGYSRSLAMNLQKNYPRQSFLECAGGLLFKYDYQLIQEFLQFLTVDNCYYQLIAKDFEGECKEKEEWYGTMYKTEQIDRGQLREWRECKEEKNEALFTPLENKYIADDFTILCEQSESKESINESLPYVIRETEESKIWFKMDSTFKKPKLCVSLRLYSPLFNDSKLSMSLTDLVISILNDELSDSTYAFEEAAMSFNAVFNGSNAIVFKFGGYNQKLSLLLQTVLSKFQSLKISPEKYEINKEKYHRVIVSMQKAQPYSHCDLVDTLFLCPKSVSLQDLEECYAQITYDNVCAQYNRIFDKLYIEALVYGNIDAQQSGTLQTYYDMIDTYLVSNIRAKYSVKERESDRKGCLKLEPNHNYCVAFKCPNSEDKNSSVSSTYLYKVDTVKDYAPLRLFAALIKAPCFDQLRTKEQLGYIVWSFNDIMKGFLSFRLIIQSNCANPNKLNCRIEQFLSSFREFIETMSDDTFEVNKRSVINNLLQTTKTIYEQNSRYWREIKSARYQFEREEKLAKEIEKLSKSEVVNFYDSFISDSSEQRTKVTVQCFGNQHSIESGDDSDKESSYCDAKVIHWNVSEVEEVRQKCGYYPFPYTDTSKL